MPYSVEISFRGLCGFVPGADLNQTQDMNWFGAMLVLANQGNAGRFGVDAPVHYPCVLFDASDVDDVGNTAFQGVFPLREEDVVFRHEEALPPGGVKVDFRKLNKEKPGTGESGAFDWVPAIENMMVGRGKIDDDCLVSTPVKKILSARVHVIRGVVSVGDISVFNGEPVIVGLGDSAIRQAIATRVVVTIENLTERLFLRTRPFTGTSGRQLTFKRKASGVLKIAIVNLCGDNMLDLISETKSLGSLLPSPDTDFKWNYILCDEAAEGDERLVPVPVRYKRFGGGGGGEPARCSPPRFDHASSPQVTTMLAVAGGV